MLAVLPDPFMKAFGDGARRSNYEPIRRIKPSGGNHLVNSGKWRWASRRVLALRNPYGVILYCQHITAVVTCPTDNAHIRKAVRKIEPCDVSLESLPRPSE